MTHEFYGQPRKWLSWLFGARPTIGEVIVDAQQRETAVLADPWLQKARLPGAAEFVEYVQHQLVVANQLVARALLTVASDAAYPANLPTVAIELPALRRAWAVQPGGALTEVAA